MKKQVQEIKINLFDIGIIRTVVEKSTYKLLLYSSS